MARFYHGRLARPGRADGRGAQMALAGGLKAGAGGLGGRPARLGG